MGLMGCQATLNSTHCMMQKNVTSSFIDGADPPRAVASTLEAQLNAAEVRLAGESSRVRTTLGALMSALPVAPALRMLHGLSPADFDLYRMVSIDSLHVLKLGLLRFIVSRLPAMLAVVRGGILALRGSVQSTLHAVGL